jgi:hypothetical protein
VLELALMRLFWVSRCGRRLTAEWRVCLRWRSRPSGKAL